ncbi:MAG: hypothetical protein WBI40_12640 [Methylococcaceae bacterium]
MKHKKTRIELLKISLELTIATINKYHDKNIDVTDDKVIESFEKCYKAVVERFNERTELSNQRGKKLD